MESQFVNNHLSTFICMSNVISAERKDNENQKRQAFSQEFSLGRDYAAQHLVINKKL